MKSTKLVKMHKEIERQHDKSMRQETKCPKRKRKGAKKY